MYILPPSIPKRIEGYRWQSFAPPAAGQSGRFRGLICHRRIQGGDNIGGGPLLQVAPPCFKWPRLDTSGGQLCGYKFDKVQVGRAKGDLGTSRAVHRCTPTVSRERARGSGGPPACPLDPRPQRQQLQAVLCVYTYRGGHTHRGVVQLRTGLRGHTGQKETPPLWTGLPCLVR